MRLAGWPGHTVMPLSFPPKNASSLHMSGLSMFMMLHRLIKYASQGLLMSRPAAMVAAWTI